MALFRKKQIRSPEVLWSVSFTQSKTFKGYRRIRLTRYDRTQIEQNISLLKDPAGRTIELQCVRLEDGHCVNVYVDALLVGTVYEHDSEQWSLVAGHRYDSAHVRFDGSVAYLFLHII